MVRTVGQATRRYGPFVAVVVLVAVGVAVFGRDGGGSATRSGAEGGDGRTPLDEEQLTRDGPMTPQKAELVGQDDVDFGPDCDPDTGRIRLPSVYAPQCVVPFEGDNDGATSTGVTAEEILLVRYAAARGPNQLAISTMGESGVQLWTDTDEETVQGLVDLYNQVFETYGRRVRVVTYTATGADDDADAARADARAIADLEPFAVIDGPLSQAAVFAEELAARGVLCLASCSVTVPEEIILANQPYLWPAGLTTSQVSELAAELIGNLAGPGRARWAGDPELRRRDRVYAVVHYNTEDGAHTAAYETLRDELADHGIEVTTDIEYQLDFARQQETARTIVARLEEDEVTTVIFYGDFITPMGMTKEATAQGYFPEWILGPNLQADTAQFARTFDQEQWANAFGLALSPARAEPAAQADIYEWAYGRPSPSPNAVRLNNGLLLLFAGIHLAGPNLKPESFRDGLFRWEPSGGGPTTPRIARGHDGLWPEVDYGGVDDAGIIWWDPDAEGPDETGNVGRGLYRHARGGHRYGPGSFPTTAEEAGLFDEDSSITVFETLPEEDRPPDYPPPSPRPR